MLRISRYLISIIVILMLVAYGTGCAGEKLPTAPGGSVTDYFSLTDNLRKAGATVEAAGEVTQPFFSAQGKVTIVNGSDVQVFEYENATAADTEAALVSSDGSSVSTSMISWVAPPHFYKAGKLIVFYVSESESVK